MPAERIYLPVSAADLAQLADTGALAVAGEVFAVTDGLRREQPGLDAEDLEYAAFCDAVADAGSRAAGGAVRRVVASADADPSWLGEPTRPDAAVSAVALTTELPLSRIASFHIDEAPVSGEALDEADDLLWYDVTELEALRSELG